MPFIPFYYNLTPYPATGYTKNPVKTKKTLEKKGEIFLFFLLAIVALFILILSQA
jgi:hypothetical protein